MTKHKTWMIAAAILLVSSIGGAVGYGAGWWRSTTQASVPMVATSTHPVHWDDASSLMRFSDGTSDNYVSACVPSSSGHYCSWDGAKWADTAAPTSGAATYVLQFPVGQQTDVDHGQFWTSGQSLTAAGPFFWEAWSEIDNSSSGYIVSDGYGPDHAILMGYSGFNPSGNVWSGTAIESIGCDDVVQAGEWHELAMAGDGSSTLYLYLDGVPCGTAAYSTRIASTGDGALYIGGSDHSNFFGKLAAIRGFEGAAPYSAYSYQTAFRPDRFYGTNVLGVDQSAHIAFLVDYTHPEAIIPDYGVYNGRSHPGRLGNAASVDKGNTNWPFFTSPVPSWVADATCPINPQTTPATTSWGYTPPSPATPPGGAVVYDSFSRADQTLANSTAPTLGTTELGGLIWQYSTNVGPMTPSSANIYSGEPWGVFKGKAVSLIRPGAWSQNVAWVNLSALGAGHSDMTVSVTRRIAASTTDTVYQPAGTAMGDGIVFRWTDYQNFCYASYWGNWGCYSGGAQTAFTGWTHSTSDTILKVVATGTTLTVYTNGVQKATTTSALNQTATGAGFQVNKQFAASMSSVGRFDDFTVN